MIALIKVQGCDDSTKIEIEIDEEKFNFLKVLSERITSTATYGCQPKMSVIKKED